MFSNMPRGSTADEHISREYAKEVLLANWQERRQVSEEKSDGIVPALHRVNACEHHLSEMQDNYYAPFAVEEAVDATQQYLDGRKDALHTFVRNREVQVRFPLAADMMDNLTTTYKIMYDILPKELRKQVADNTGCTVPAKPQDLDLMLSYGNRTTTGRRCHQREELRLEKIQKMQTTYAANFNVNRFQS